MKKEGRKCNTRWKKYACEGQRSQQVKQDDVAYFWLPSGPRLTKSHLIKSTSLVKESKSVKGYHMGKKSQGHITLPFWAKSHLPSHKSILCLAHFCATSTNEFMSSFSPGNCTILEGISGGKFRNSSFNIEGKIPALQVSSIHEMQPIFQPLDLHTLWVKLEWNSSHWFEWRGT